MSKCKSLVLTAAMLAGAGTAGASTVDYYTLEAESQTGAYSDFWLSFEDSDHDGKYGSGDSILDFSGITHTAGGLLGGLTEVKYDLVGVIDWKLDLIGHLVDGAGYLVWDVGSEVWEFKKQALLGTEWLIADLADFKYKLIQHGGDKMPAVPLPATGLMLIGALAGLYTVRRRRV